MNRHRITWPLLLTLTALFTLSYSTTPAQAATMCGFVAPTATVTIDPGTSAKLVRSGSAIRLNGSACGAATVLNTDTVVVTGAGGAETFTVDLSGGPFAPGASPEGSGASEIELEVDLGAGADKVVLQGTGGDDTYRLGSIGINLNNDNDADITGPGGGVIPTIGAELFSVLGAAGSDVLTGEQAVAGVGSAVPAPMSLDLQGGDNDDTLKGGAYDDLLDGGFGVDLIKGNAGIDTSTYATRGGRVLVDIGGALDGTDANNDGIAEEGDTTTPDVDNLIGGKAPDTLIGSDGRNVLTGGQGNDDLRGLGAIDTLDGGPGADKLAGGDRDDIEHGGPDNDTFDQGAGTAANGADDLFGEAGSDTVDYSARNTSVAVKLDGVANDGLDTNHDGVGVEEKDNVRTDIERVRGGQDADTLIGGNLAETLLGNGGGDLLDGGLGPDLLDGGAGVDTVSYGQRTDMVWVTADGFAANDGDFLAKEGDNVTNTVENLRGGHGDDDLYGNASVNLLEGGEGDDVLDGREGPDVFVGGPDRDAVTFITYDQQARTASLRVTLDDVANDGTDANLDGFSEESDNVRSDVELVFGGDAHDVLIGNGGDNGLYGIGGDDELYGQGGVDFLSGWDGNDSLSGGEGGDTLKGEGGNDDFFEDSAPNGADDFWGGSGRDTVHYSGRSWPVAILLDDLANDGDFATSEGDNVHVDVEDAIGGSGPDAFQGSSVVNHFSGGPGNDGMHGNDGNDVLSGGIDNDTLYGDNGDDALSGNLGNDELHGDLGRDVMLEDSGPNGADTFTDGDTNATVDYSSRTVDLIVSMDGLANDGADVNGDRVADEGDNVDPSISVVDGGSGNDVMISRPLLAPTPAILNGNIGSDYLQSGEGGVDPYFHQGTFLNGGADNDWLEGGRGRDDLDGGPGDDVERGNGDDDTFHEGSGPNGADLIDGNGSCCSTGGARDTVDYSARFSAVRVDPDDSADDGDFTGGTSEGDNVGSNVEVLRGGFGNDELTGNNGGNVIYGQGGNDIIEGAEGPDIVYGDWDTPMASDGNDVVDGGEGDDFVYGQGGIDSLLGGLGDDIITGGPGSDGIDAGADDDILHVQDGVVDTVDGGPGTDAADFDANDILSNIP
jgi:Ca2+-binding RTX toxin-like protein